MKKSHKITKLTSRRSLFMTKLYSRVSAKSRESSSMEVRLRDALSRNAGVTKGDNDGEVDCWTWKSRP